MSIEFRILGPLEVRVDGAAVAIGGPRQRALLAMLLLSANRAVSRDRLIDELLVGAPADRADHMLRVQVSRLRSVLASNGTEAERLITRTPGYLLRIDPGELDLHAFETYLAEGHQALEEADFEHAAASLRKAEALWRGRPLADLEFERFARIDIERLEELRLIAAEDRSDAELALGRHSLLVPELEARVAEHPLRERSRGQLMLALYRCGRQADALEAFRSGRALMSNELALEPGPALRRMEQSILRQEPRLDLPERRSAAVATQVGPPASAGRQERGDTFAPPAPPRKRRRRGIIAVVALIVIASAGAVVVALTAGGNRALAAAPNSVGVLDAGTEALSAVIPAGGPPGGIAAGAGAVWETDTADDQILRIDPRSRSVQRIRVGRNPTGVAVGGGEVWVVNQLDRTVAEINPNALSQVGLYRVGNGPGAIVFGDGSVWVANVIDDTISRLDPRTGRVVTIPLAGQPGGIAVGPQGIWVASQSTGQLLLVDPVTNRVTQAVPIGNEPAGVAIGAGNIWVANTADDTVSKFDPGSGTVTKINVGRGPVGVAFGGGAVWVADSLDGTVGRITPGTGAVAVLHLGGSPSALAVSHRQVWTTVLPGAADHRGGNLKVVEGATFQTIGDSLDPALFAGFSQWQMLSLTNDGLVTYRRVGGLAGTTLVPDLATRLPAPTDNGRTYTFQMRSGIHYSNGAPVRPDDIRHEFERIFRLGNGYAEGFYTGIVGAQDCLHVPKRCSFARGIVADERANTVTFHLKAPDPDFLYKLAFPWADAIPAGTPYRDLGRSMPPATGPYMTRSISKSRQPGPPGHGQIAFHTWVLARNPRFREWSSQAQPQGYPNTITLTDDASAERAATAVARGGIDVLLPVPPDRLTDFATHYTERFHSEPVGGIYAPVMNTRVAPFDHVSVRRALNYAIDRNVLVRAAGGPLAAQPTCQVLPPNIPGYAPYCPYTRDPGPGGAWHGPDMAKARRLVASSGTHGMKVTVVVPPPSATNPSGKIGSYLVSVLKRLGYRASLRETSDAYPLIANSRSRVQLGWSNWYQDYPAPSDFITVLLTCHAFRPDDPSNLNDSGFCDPRVDAAVGKASALQVTNPGGASLGWSAIDRAVTNQAPMLPMYNPRRDIATSSRLGNYQYHPFWGLLLDELWVQ